MKATVLCSFDNIDLAEIAVGKLKASVPGIEHIEISRPSFEEPEEHIHVLPLGTAGDGTSVGVGAVSNGIFPIFTDFQGEDEDSARRSDYIPRSVTVRVTCTQAQRSAVEAKLINLGGLRIRSSNALDY
ncbi:MAG: hypothetical protein HFG26_06780 [Provencibacterium sp.]|jgi:hypothetical protein|nr:hypothetical protein [Provencibacterium sp.]